MNILLSGPCGIGKTAIASRLSINLRIKHVDLDKFSDLPCTRGWFDLNKCMPILQKEITGDFILDVGGSTIFHRGVDNDNHLKDILSVKQICQFIVITLFANKEIAEKRFKATRSSYTLTQDDFEKIWLEWNEIILPYWEKCLDFLVDTSYLSIDQTCQIIEKLITSG
jgi:cytidylate kinase